MDELMLEDEAKAEKKRKLRMRTGAGESASGGGRTPRMLLLALSDGHVTCRALEVSPCPKLK
jgi:hypothetical protein